MQFGLKKLLGSGTEQCLPNTRQTPDTSQVKLLDSGPTTDIDNDKSNTSLSDDTTTCEIVPELR